MGLPLKKIMSKQKILHTVATFKYSQTTGYGVDFEGHVSPDEFFEKLNKKIHL